MPALIDDFDQKVQGLQAALLGQLALLRKQLGLTQKEVAERMGVSRMTVVRTEDDGGSPHLSNCIRMALALGHRLELEPLDADKHDPAAPPLVHRGVHYARTRGDASWRDRQREKALSRAWEAANKESEGQPPVVQYLVPGCSQEQAIAMATAIQWLGSDVGFEFLRQALDKAGYELVDRQAAGLGDRR